jgi:hypothetical protein
MWARIGVRAKLNAMPLAPFFPKIQKRRHQLYLLGWGVPTSTRSTRSRACCSRATAQPGNGIWNYGRYSFPGWTADRHHEERARHDQAQRGHPRGAAHLPRGRAAHPAAPPDDPVGDAPNVNTVHMANNQLDGSVGQDRTDEARPRPRVPRPAGRIRSPHDRLRHPPPAAGRARDAGGGASSPSRCSTMSATRSLIMLVLVGVPMGVYTGLNRNSWLSRVFLTFADRRVAADLPDRHPADPHLSRVARLAAVLRPRRRVQLGWWSTGLLTATG